MAQPLISVRDLKKTYDLGETQVHALQGVTLDVMPGEFVALTGPSGSGKSTFMHLLGCLDRPTDGEYLFDGRDVAEPANASWRGFEMRRDRLRLPGIQPAVADDRAGERGAAAAVRRRSRRPGTTRARGGSAAGRWARRAARSSPEPALGRPAAASRHRARAGQPSQLLLADEPTGNLDTRTSIEVMDIFQRLNQDRA